MTAGILPRFLSWSWAPGSPLPNEPYAEAYGDATSKSYEEPRNQLVGAHRLLS